jgi:hypothetical protein
VAQEALVEVVRLDLRRLDVYVVILSDIYEFTHGMEAFDVACLLIYDSAGYTELASGEGIHGT